MGQETERRKDEEQTGTDQPSGEGIVSDDSINAITDDGTGKPTGQDHSLDNYADTIPDHGVADIQDSSDTSSDIARIRE